MEDLNVLTLKDFDGGISPTPKKGVRGSFAFGRGLNIRERNTLTCNQKLTKDSSTTVTDLPLVGFRASDGNEYAFGDTGKVYRKTSGTWALVYTDAGGRISGACEFKSTSGSFILYATQTKLRKISLANAGGTWTGNVSDAGTFTNGIAGDFHTMRVAIGVVLIEDGDLLAMYDYDDAFAPAALRMSTGTKGKAMLDRSNRVIVGGKENDDGKFITWDRLQDSWIDKKSAQGPMVNGMGFLELGVVAQVGDEGHLKYWNFGETSPLIKIPGVANCYPGGVTEYGTLTHFGMNGGTKNGVYSIGKIDNNSPRALNLEYVPSHGKLTGTEIGAIWKSGTDLYVAWKDGSTYGIDKTDATAKATAVYESLEMTMEKPHIDKTVRFVKAVLEEPCPAGATVGLKYRSSLPSAEETAAADADGWITAKMNNEDTNITEGEVKGIWTLEAKGEIQEIQMTLTPSGNDAPEVAYVNVYFDFDNAI